MLSMSSQRKRLMRERDRRRGITEVLLRVPKRDSEELKRLAKKRLEAYLQEIEAE